MCTEPVLGAEGHQLQGGQCPLAEIEFSALVLKATSTRGIRSPCLLVKTESEEFINTAFLCGKFNHQEHKQKITGRGKSLKDDKVK